MNKMLFPLMLVVAGCEAVGTEPSDLDPNSQAAKLLVSTSPAPSPTLTVERARTGTIVLTDELTSEMPTDGSHTFSLSATTEIYAWISVVTTRPFEAVRVDWIAPSGDTYASDSFWLLSPQGEAVPPVWSTLPVADSSIVTDDLRGPWQVHVMLDDGSELHAHFNLLE